jgi:hypothetical protein
MTDTWHSKAQNEIWAGMTISFNECGRTVEMDIDILIISNPHSALSARGIISTNTELSRDGVYCGEGERDESPTDT